MIVNQLQPPYYAVIFTSILMGKSTQYAKIASTLEKQVEDQKGFLSMDTVRSDIGITVSYWKTMEDINKWKRHLYHIEAQDLGKVKFYQQYNVRIAKVEKEYSFKHLNSK